MVHLNRLRKQKRAKKKKNEDDLDDDDDSSYDSDSSSSDEEENDDNNDDNEENQGMIKDGLDENGTPEDYYYDVKYHPDANVLIKLYLHLAKKCNEIVLMDSFNYFILFTIVIAGLLVGLETYDSIGNNPAVLRINTLVLVVFILEFLLKCLAEGLLPYRYFTNREWKWNWFDCTIIILSFPQWGALFGGGSIKMLRLIRLTRLGKIVRRIPPLQMIIRGILGGLKSCGYITLLQILVFYIFSVIGYYFFSINDPFHYGSVPYAMFTLFRLYTLDNWGDFMFVNTYGCNQYQDMYINDEDQTPFNYRLWCNHPQQYWYAPFFCLVFILVAQMIILSLFIGAVSNSMMDSMELLQKQREEFIKQQLYEKNKNRILAFAKPGSAEQTSVAVIGSSTSSKGSPNSQQQQQQKKRRAGFREHVEYDTIQEGEEADGGKIGALEAPPQLSIFEKIHLWCDIAYYYITYPLFVAYESCRLIGVYFYMVEDAHYRNELTKLMYIAMKYEAHDELRGLQKAKRLQNGEYPDKKVVTKVQPKGSLTSVGIAPAGNSETGLLIAPPTLSKYAVIDINIRNIKKNMPSNFGEFFSLSAKISRVIAESKSFNNFVTFIILCAAVDIGFQTDYRVMKDDFVMAIVGYVDTIILTVFTCELIFKVLAEEYRPWAYFYSGWNCFDFIIVMSSYFSGAGALLLLLRLLRLLRVLKLVKKLPRLSIIINAFLIAGQSIGWALVLLLLFHYIFGIIGLMLFKDNDPHRFGSLHKSMLAVFRLISLDDSSYMAYNNAWGCDLYPDIPYDINPQWCVKPTGVGIISFLYYITLVTIGNQILLSLFIGVLSTSLDQARTNFLKEKEFDEKISEFCNTLYQMTPKRVQAFKTAFKLLDIDNSDVLDDDKLRLGLAMLDSLELTVSEEYNAHNAGYSKYVDRKPIKMTEEEIQYLLRMIDTTGTGVGLHIIGFIKFMCGTAMFLENERVSRTVELWYKRNERKSRQNNSSSLFTLAGVKMLSPEAQLKMMESDLIAYKYKSAVANIDNFQDAAAQCIQLAYRRHRAMRVVKIRRTRSKRLKLGSMDHDSFQDNDIILSDEVQAEILQAKHSAKLSHQKSEKMCTDESIRPAVMAAMLPNKKGDTLHHKVIDVPDFIFANDNMNYIY